ncbi:hypothetical protein BASP5262_06840 [Bacillus spizizenii]|nr:hypothetical protein DJ97_2690 [Bacillus spizizenii]SPT95615.1 Uncharacterised protein [Bacillus spizizenii]
MLLAISDKSRPGIITDGAVRKTNDSDYDFFQY